MRVFDMKLGEWIKNYRVKNDYSMQTFADKCGFSKAYVAILENGINPSTGKPVSPTIQIFKKIADATLQDVNEFISLLDRDQPVTISPAVITNTIPNIKNIFPLKTKKIPLIGTIAAGVPLLAEEQFECYVETSDNIKADFCLRVKGDSMVNARINDGDIVFIIKQPDVDDGEIAAVLIDSEATLKRVYKMPGAVKLVAENSKYKPLLYTENNCDELIILGKAIAFQSKVH